MLNEEKYEKFLKQIISCISHGDYYSVKELSQLELEKIKKNKKIKKQGQNEEIEKFTEWMNDFQVTEYTGRSEQITTLSGEKEWL